LAQKAAASSTGATVAVPVMCRNIVDSALEDWRKLLEKNTNEFLPSRVRCSLLRSLPTHEKFSISRSVVGQNVVIGTDVEIENSVIMDGAEIGSGAKVRNSVVCARCVVPEGADIKNAFRADMFSED
jgi:ADP-glucose pyrophosphorylase